MGGVSYIWQKYESRCGDHMSQGCSALQSTNPAVACLLFDLCVGFLVSIFPHHHLIVIVFVSLAPAYRRELRRRRRAVVARSEFSILLIRGGEHP